MASSPDQDPDSIPAGPEGDVERISESTPVPQREGVEDSPGTDGGTAGTGDGSGQSTVQDQQYER